MHFSISLMLAGVAAAAVSPDWTCGGTNKYTCPAGYCCSKWGWCGITDAYCGVGCQSTFGKCGAVAPTTLRTSTFTTMTTAKTSTSSKAGTTSQKSTTSSTSMSIRTTATTTTSSFSSTSKSSTSPKSSTTSKATVTSSMSSTVSSVKTATSTRPTTTLSSTSLSTTKTSSTPSTAPSSTSKSTSATSSAVSTTSKISSSNGPTTSTTSRSSSSTALTSTVRSPTSSSTRSSASTVSTTSVTSSTTATPTPNSGKRGLAYNDAALTQPFSLSGQDSRVSWGWNWYSAPGDAFNPALKFVPQLWSDAWSLTSIWEANIADAQAHHGADSLLAFNEPDNCGGQACMVVPQAVYAYQTWLQPHAGRFRLGAPAVTNAATPGAGLDWLTAFLGNCTGCTVDFLPLHVKNADARQPEQLQAFVQQAHARFPDKPLWLTEYAVAAGTAPADALAWMREVVPWLDAQSYVQRHAYFMDAPGDAYLINANRSGLNDLGKYYNSGN